MHEQCDRTTALFHVADIARRRVDLALICKELLAAHGFRSRLAFAEFLRTRLAADLNDSLADFDFDGGCIEGAVARCTCFLSHRRISLSNPDWGTLRRPLFGFCGCRNL